MTINQWKSKQGSGINLTNNKQKASNKSSNYWLLGAFSNAVVATFCCLPALLFLLFGSSFGLLAIFAPLEKFRLLLTALSLLCFCVFIWARFYRKRCRVDKDLRARGLFFAILAFLGLILLLFYPEIVGVFYL